MFHHVRRYIALCRIMHQRTGVCKYQMSLVNADIQLYVAVISIYKSFAWEFHGENTWNESINPVSHCRCISVNYFICVTVERTKWRVCYLFVITILLPGNWTNFQLWLAVWKYVNVLFFVCHMSSFLFPNYNCSDWSRTWCASCLSLPWIQCILNPPEKNMVLNWRWP